MPASIAKRLVAVNLALVVVAGFAGVAGAHPEFAPQTINRYVKFDLVAPDGVRLAYTVMVGAAPAAAARAQADANHDGHVDAAEAQAIGRRMQEAVAAGITLTVDGKRVVPTFDTPEVGLAGDAVGASPFSVDLVARIACPGAPPHTIGFDDAPAEPLMGETEIRVEEAPTTQLVASHRGATGSEKQTRFVFSGPKFSALEDRSIAFTFTAAKAPEPVKPREKALPLRFVAVGAIALLAGVLLLLLLRQRRMKG